MKTIALLGNPNSGKSTLFNNLTGLNQKIGNYPGVTVDKRSGHLTIEGVGYTLIDFPGAYSLHPKSEDERIVLRNLLDTKSENYPDLILYVLDITQIDKQLLLLSQIIDLGFDVIVLLNMNDIYQISEEKIHLLRNKFKVEIHSISTREFKSSRKIKDIVKNHVASKNTPSFFQVEYKNPIPQSIPNPYRSFLVINHMEHLGFLDLDTTKQVETWKAGNSFNHVKAQVEDVMSRFRHLEPLISRLKRTQQVGHVITDKLDAVLSHNFWGILVFLAIMLFVFQSIFSFASIPQDLIDGVFGNIQSNLTSILPEQWYSNLLIDGIIAGIGGVVIFIPQIFILFFLLGILEDTGYMSRIVYLLDGTMRKFGLNGRSVVSMISGGACAIPAVMSARTIANWKERLITIMVTPFISCAARLPVFAILITLCIPKKNIWGFISAQGLTLMGLYILGALTAVGVAWIFHKTLKSNEASFLMIELPNYKWPNIKNIFINALSKIKTFTFEAGKIILVISIVLWALASYGPKNAMKDAVVSLKLEQSFQNLTPEEQDVKIQSVKLSNSYAGIFGHTIEPVIKPLGYDWKIGIALLTSFAAREVFVGTMSTIYAVENEDEGKLIDRLRNEKNPETGKIVFNFATGMSLLIFYLYAMQCMSTLAIVKRETKSWKWPIIQFVMMTGIAYVASLITYQLLN